MAFKYLILLTAAQVLSSQAIAEGYTKGQIQKFMTNNKFCQMAWGFEHKGSTAAVKKYLGNQILCIGNMKLNIGTIKEISGCAFGIYDAEDSTIRSPYWSEEDPSKLHKSGFPIVEGAACESGGFEKLKSKYAGMFYGSVEQAITRGWDAFCGTAACGENFATPTLVFSSVPSIEAWWHSAVVRAAIDSEAQKKTREKKAHFAKDAVKRNEATRVAGLSEQDAIHEFCENFKKKANAEEELKDEISPSRTSHYQPSIDQRKKEIASAAQKMNEIQSAYKTNFRREIAEAKCGNIQIPSDPSTGF